MLLSRWTMDVADLLLTGRGAAYMSWLRELERRGLDVASRWFLDGPGLNSTSRDGGRALFGVAGPRGVKVLGRSFRV